MDQVRHRITGTRVLMSVPYLPEGGYRPRNLGVRFAGVPRVQKFSKKAEDPYLGTDAASRPEACLLSTRCALRCALGIAVPENRLCLAVTAALSELGRIADASQELLASFACMLRSTDSASMQPLREFERPR
eukprot:1251828-Rhodomonas_salina.1